MAHLKRQTAPRSWKIQVKGIKFISKPLPGPHKLDDCIPLVLLLKRLGYANTTREVKRILNQGHVLVDKVIRKNHRFPVGTMDILSLPSTKEAYRLFVLRENVTLVPVKESETNLKFNKIVGKKTLAKDKIQLNFYDGRNAVIKKDDYNVGDSVIYDLDKKEIKSHLKLEKGARVYLIGGKHRGAVAVVEDLQESKYLKSSSIILKTEDNKKIETLKEYAFVIDKSINFPKEK